MKIWIDLTNSPHVNFFKPFIKKWDEEGHKIILTARNLANTVDLIHQEGWNFEEVGGHAGKSKTKKILHFPTRVFKLRKYLRELQPQVGISQSSFYSPLVCRLLGIPSIYLNDNEHAKGNDIAFKFATQTILPEFLKDKANSAGWMDKYSVEFYPGIKEGIYLSQFNFDSNHSLDQKAVNKENIYIRLEPWTAEYYSGNSDFMDSVIEKLSKNYPIIILPRSKEQGQYFDKEKFKNVKVAVKPISLQKIYKDCKLFIGAGGTMTRELAFLGVPTLSVYQGDLLEVDKYLIKNKFMKYNSKPHFDYILELLNEVNTNQENELKLKGQSAFNFINQKINHLVKN